MMERNDDSYRLLRNETRVKIFGLGFRKRPTFRARSPGGKRYSVVLITLVSSTALVIVLLLIWHGYHTKSTKLQPLDPVFPLPPSPSKLYEFPLAAVCTDGPPCSKIGRNILKAGGNAVDATVAAMFCNGIVNSQSMGLGGGFLMTLYVKGKPYSLLARESAPAAATRDMFNKNPMEARTGGLAVGVPGELLGYWEVWKKFGSLSWSQLVKPSIDLCHKGYILSKPQYDSLLFRPDTVKKHPTFRGMFIDPFTGDLYKPGSLIKPNRFCETLEIIQKEGGNALHNGSLTLPFVSDIREERGIISESDMNNYRVEWADPVNVTLSDGNTIYSVPPPGSGALLTHIMSILDNVVKDPHCKGAPSKPLSPTCTNATILLTHRTIEAFKFAFAKRPALVDPNFFHVAPVLKQMTSEEYSKNISLLINDTSTSKDGEDYGSVEYTQDDHGTAHISVLSKEGDAVSVTSTINLYFGAGFISKTTGIIPNSVMDDFSIPGADNYFSLKPSPTHFIEPGKRPLSSACPTIVTDSKGQVNLVIGASGGTKIPTAIAWVMMRYLWLGDTIKEAIDASRVHHQLYPMKVSYEYGILEDVLKGLKRLGHEVERYRERGSIVCGIAKQNDRIYANADYRKGGEVFGY